jgi:lactoylglutathione lyase
MQFSQVRLLVDNFDACFRFYRDVLGLPVGFGEEGDVYADFRIGNDATLALFGRRDMAAAIGAQESAKGGDQVVITFQVDDLDRALTRLREYNVELVAPPMDRPEWGERTAHLRDPDGNLIEIFVPIPMAG